MPKRPLLLSVLLVVAVTAGCGGGGSGGAPSQSFVFTVNNGTWSEIWLMDADGRKRTQLTASQPPQSQAAGNTNPAWSPDGKHIVYTGTGDWPDTDPSHQELYVMDGKGGHVEQLTSNAVPDWSPDWSPDGKQIVFVEATTSGSDDLRSAIFVMNSDGSSKKLIYRDPNFPGSHLMFSPAWSPDGKEVAFMRVTFTGTTTKTAVYTMRSDGTDATVIVKDAAEPDWSPDGKEIAYTTSSDHLGQTCFQECSGSGEIYVANADGSDPRRLTTSKADDVSPTWSPDGKQIAFVSDQSNRSDHQDEIYVVNAGGGTPERITRNDVWDLEPDWK